ncbi:uncharacterized protein CLUP02_14709 [Colletotrichum lupini]|uniref:Uncharacterized protein n=1 Tax=Colletotrichum lupini TaxID=145971 RepID=A0A9Q8WMZ3_9PEZI|nr:uncharacterized protein CLUP02_14709 [Colletotrichum lupini]UQC89181.1 hypothetical protein CLUP02_14709 [Colletotrichum lupini]
MPNQYSRSKSLQAPIPRVNAVKRPLSYLQPPTLPKVDRSLTYHFRPSSSICSRSWSLTPAAQVPTHKRRPSSIVQHTTTTTTSTTSSIAVPRPSVYPRPHFIRTIPITSPSDRSHWTTHPPTNPSSSLSHELPPFHPLPLHLNTSPNSPRSRSPPPSHRESTSHHGKAANPQSSRPHSPHSSTPRNHACPGFFLVPSRLRK